MDAGIFQIISIISFCLAGVSFVIAVYLFFSSRIIAVVGDLSGKTAQKQIKAIRQQNEQSGDKRYRPSLLNLGRGRITEKVIPSGRLESGIKNGNSMRLKNGTGQEPIDSTDLLPDFQNNKESTENTELLIMDDDGFAGKTEPLNTPTYTIDQQTEVLAGKTEALADTGPTFTKIEQTCVHANTVERRPDALAAGAEPTSVLENSTDDSAYQPRRQEKKLQITEKIVMIHTDEVIE